MINAGYDIDVPNRYPTIFRHLKEIGDKFEIEKENKKSKSKGLYNRDDQGQNWWNLRACAYMEDFSKQKIIFSKASKEQAFAFDDTDLITLNTSYIATGKNIKYILGILNSKLAKYIFLKFFQSGGIDGEITIQAIELIPIPKILVEMKNDFENLIEQTISLKIQGNQTIILEEKIDKIVYELYTLTKEEILFIEQNMAH